MDSAQQLLFGEFPRAMGVTTPDHGDMELRQYLVHSEREFDGVVGRTSGSRNLYSSISAYEPVRVDGEFEGCAVIADKVSFDFDSSAKADPNADYRWEHPLIENDAPDKRVIERMRSEETILKGVLGDVCYNVRKLAEFCIEQDWPIIGVFSGFGVHVHILHEVTKSRAGDKMLSTCNRLASELELSCTDERASGRPFRIMRIPNVERICHDSESSTRLYQVPLTAAEMAEIEPAELLDLSTTPRPSIGSGPRSRPEMKVQEDYLGPRYDEGVGQEKMRPAPDDTYGEEFAQKIIRDMVQMPCVYERAFGRNPPNDVRVKLGIMLLNGYEGEVSNPVEMATDLISRLNWVDFDRETTSYQLRKLKQSGKGDWSCKTMQAKGLCTRADNKTDCPKYGYQGGNKPWKET